MGDPSATSVNESANDLFDRWMAHRQQESGEVDKVTSGVASAESPDEPTEPTTESASPVIEPALAALAEPVIEPVIEPAIEPDEEPGPEPTSVARTVGTDPDEVIATVEEFEEFAHPVPVPGPAPVGTSDAPSPSDPEAPEAPEAVEVSPPAPASALAPPPVTAGAPRAEQVDPPVPASRPDAAPVTGLVLFSPHRGVRHLFTVAAAILAAGVGIAGYVAWQAQTPAAVGLAGALVVAVLLVWKLRSRAAGTQITVEDGMLRIAQGSSRHQFPLAGPHPPIDIIGEPGQRGWKVLIQRRGLPPFVITRKMADPVELSRVIRHFRPQA